MRALSMSLILSLVFSVSFANANPDVAQLGKTLIASSTDDVRELPFTLKSLVLNKVDRDAQGAIRAISYVTPAFDKYTCAYDRSNEQQVCAKYECDAEVNVQLIRYEVKVTTSNVTNCKFVESIRN